MSEHTPLPWTYDPDNGCLRGPDLEVIAEVYGLDFPDGSETERKLPYKANAEYIVRACNAHEELVAALELIRKGTRVEMADWLVNNTKTQFSKGALENQSLAAIQADIASAALAKARAES